MAAIDDFATKGVAIDSPAVGAYAITPDDDTDLAVAIRCITIGGDAGTVSYISSRDGQTYTSGTLPSGGSFPLLASRIRSTGTTATAITGWS